MPTKEKTSTREIILNHLLKHDKSNACQLADCVGISVQAMRRQLRCMELEGLVKANVESNGPGRPSNNWELTIEGHKAFHDGSERFALDLLKTISNDVPKEIVSNVLESQALKKANEYSSVLGFGGIEERLRKLLELRREEGFLSECIPDEDGNGWLLNEYHCSVRKIAEEYPCVCDQELAVLRYTLADCDVERVKWRVEKGHACGFHINLKQQ